jgi:hypothetical protein
MFQTKAPRNTVPSTTAASLRSAFALAGAIIAAATPLNAASLTWTAEGNPDQTWLGSGYANWGGVNPAGNDLVFDATGTSSSATTVTSVIDSDVSATSLLFHYNSPTQYHVLQIDAGATLSLAGATNLFRVGGYAETNVVTNTHAAITSACLAGYERTRQAQCQSGGWWRI